jgi:hypothetical protein
MSKLTVKQMMEREWERPGCARPGRPAGWRLAYGDSYLLLSDQNPLVPDQDESRPLLPKLAVKTR